MYGIIGYPLQTTFSPDYFNKKFKDLNIDDRYEKFPLETIADFRDLLRQQPDLKGLSVTIPHKLNIIPFLDSLDDTAQKIGAVNCIQFKNGKLVGFNTDCIGFSASLKPLLKVQHQKALILGTGGASRAVAFALEQLSIPYKFVSRTKEEGQFDYNEITPELLQEYKLIINTTPLGMKPYWGQFPDIPYSSIGSDHLLYDLICQAEETPFVSKGKAQKAIVKDGYEMLIRQAEAAWSIWNAV